MKRKIKHTDKELAEAHVFPSELSASDKKQSENEVTAFRNAQIKKMSENDRSYSRILQLKYTMEEYFKDDTYDNIYTFSYFLKEYIHSINMKSSDFSKVIDLHSTKLSRLLNDREKPNDKILIRLAVHSDNSIPLSYWSCVIEKQNRLELINDKALIKSESKNVNSKLDFSSVIKRRLSI